MKNFIFIISLVIISCTANNQDNCVINLEKTDEISILDIVDSISVVQLETNSQCLISNISKIIPVNDRYYIMDWKLHTIFCFDKKGKFLFKIAKRGRGPEEYTYLDDFNVDPYNHQLMLLVPFGDILYFDMNGKFISKVKLPNTTKAYNEVYALDGENLLFVSLSDYQIAYYSKNENRIIKNLYPRDDTPFLFSPTNRTFSYNDSIYFYSILDNKVLNMSDKNQKVAFLLDFGKKNYSPQKIAELKEYLKQQELQLQQNKKRFSLEDVVGDNKYLNYYVITYFESARYRIAMLEYKNDYLSVLIDKKEGKNFVFRKTKEGIRLISPYLFDESIILYDYGSNVKRDLTYYSKSVLSAEQLKIVESNNPEKDNPFLVVYKLKK